MERLILSLEHIDYYLKISVYQDLGLLIIDEEQRFGVTHKEKIKQIKTNVDVLTLNGNTNSTNIAYVHARCPRFIGY